MGYAEDSDEFEAMAKICRERFRFNKLYDIYKDYDGINNIKTINDDNARNKAGRGSTGDYRFIIVLKRMVQ